jgi:hypothetical protein
VAVEDGAKDNHYSTMKYIPEKEKAVSTSGVVISFMKQDYLHRDNKTTVISVSKFDIGIWGDGQPLLHFELHTREREGSDELRSCDKLHEARLPT